MGSDLAYLRMHPGAVQATPFDDFPAALEDSLVPFACRGRSGSVSDPRGTQKGFKKGPRKMHPAGHGMGSNRTRIGSQRRARWLPVGSLFDSIQDPFPFRWSSQLAPVLDPIWILFRSDSDPFHPFWIHFTLHLVAKFGSAFAPFRGTFWIPFISFWAPSFVDSGSCLINF